MGFEDLVRRLLRMSACADDECPLGPIIAVYVDHDTERPELVGVQLGRASLSERLVPLVRAGIHTGSRLAVDIGRRAVEEAPPAPGRDLRRADEDEMYRYYAQVISGTSWDEEGIAASPNGAGPIRLRRLTRQDLGAQTPPSGSDDATRADSSEIG